MIALPRGARQRVQTVITHHRRDGRRLGNVPSLIIALLTAADHSDLPADSPFVSPPPRRRLAGQRSITRAQVRVSVPCHRPSTIGTGAPGRRVALELELKKMEAVRPEPRSDIDTVCHVTVASSCPRGRAAALHIHAVVACCHAFMAQTARQQPRKS